MRLWRAWTTLLMLSFRRLVVSANTLMVLVPLAFCALFLAFEGYDDKPLSPENFDDFSDHFVFIVFTSFIVPICALAYGTTSIGGDREDRTLLFLLVRPVPRPLILLAKLAATLPLVIGLVVVAFFGFCLMAGDIGRLAFRLYLPPVFYMTVAYVSLFHLFAVSFRHSTIIALVYSLFMEFFLGNMPGIVKRIAVNYYGRSMIFDIGADHGVNAPDPEWFVPISAGSAALWLLGIAAGGLALTVLVFQRREYRDLT